MELDIDLIIYYIRLFVTNMCVYYCFEKISNIGSDKRIKNNCILGLLNLILVFAYIVVKSKFNSFISFVAMGIIYSISISILTNVKLGHSLIITMLTYAMLAIFHTLSVIIQFVPYKILETFYNFENMFVSLIIITAIELTLLYLFFKIKRFRNGFSFINNKFNNDITDIIVINLSAIVIIMYCLFEVYPKVIRKNLLLTFVLLAIIMFFTIKKMITMYYKQKLLTDTLEENKAELLEKQNEIERLTAEKENISKIAHEFDKRQKALELLVTSNMNMENIDKENVSPKVLEMIETLTKEYSERTINVKQLPKLDECGILEIDNMFKYMQSECYKDNINFKLKIMGNIHSLVNNIIPKNKLETLIGDHLKDAINAVNLTNNENKEILAILGIKNKKYELSIYDTGVDFEIETFLKLGLERVTTGADRGGSGIGFMTTFETLDETKASLIITEYPVDDNRQYTKCVTIKFDGKHQYKICSYRAKEIKEYSKDGRIKIEEYKEYI